MPAQLDSRTRVLRAIAHDEVDRVPCFFRAEEDVLARLREAFGLSDLLDITRYFGGDTTLVSLHPAFPDLADVETIDDVEALAWPSRETADVEGCVARAKDARATGLAVLGGTWASIFTGPRREMGEAKFLMAMLDEPELIAHVVEKATESCLDLNAAIFSRAAADLDVFYFGSDFGTQQSMFISGAAYRQFFKEPMRRLVTQAKEYGLPVMFHTCGAVRELIPDFIDIGLDMLDPIQASATGMAPTALAPLFKGQIAFHGGVSTQTTLPHGTPDQVRAETTAAIDALGPSGYLCGPDQELIGDTPVENIVAMYEAIHRYGG
jgi:uroporphyrinogen decarboxylase